MNGDLMKGSPKSVKPHKPETCQNFYNGCFCSIGDIQVQIAKEPLKLVKTLKVFWLKFS